MEKKSYSEEVIIAGGGLAGITAAFELLDHGKRVALFERDKKENFGGLAKKSFGGIMLINTPHQKRSGISDSPDLAFQDWLSYAEFEDTDSIPKQWARSYVDRSDELIFRWLDDKKVEFLPVVNWPERGLYTPGNSVPRWHITWGTGYELINKIVDALENHPNRHLLSVHFRHKVDHLISKNGAVCGVSGVDESSNTPFEASGEHVIIASGGICGGDLSALRKHWYTPWGKAPTHILNGSHQYADGLLHEKVAESGGNLTHLDKHWLYAAGVHHPTPEKPNDGLSLVPARSALWLNAQGRRFSPIPLVPYTDTRFLVEQIVKSGHDYSWQVLNWKIAIKELAVSGSDFMTAFRNKSKLGMLKNLVFGNKELVKRLQNECVDVVTANSLEQLCDKMNALTGSDLIEKKVLSETVSTYDSMLDRGKRYHNDHQLRWIANFRTYRGDRLRTCNFQKISDESAGPFIAIRQFILSRKSLGGIQTDLDCRVLKEDGTSIPGLYAVGEAAGFGGGGIHGKRSLEGTFLGGCILTGRICGERIASL